MKKEWGSVIIRDDGSTHHNEPCERESWSHASWSSHRNSILLDLPDLRITQSRGIIVIFYRNQKRR